MLKYKDFEKQINEIKKAGFNIIAVSHLYTFDVYIFKTQKEANAAYNALEKNVNYKEAVCFGYWYGIRNFEKEVSAYKKESGLNVEIITLTPQK